VVGRWLAYIRLFSSDIAHVPGTRHKGPDALSRRPPTTEEKERWKRESEKHEEDLERFIESKLHRMSGIEETGEAEESEESEEYEDIWEDDEVRGKLTSEIRTGTVEDYSWDAEYAEVVRYLQTMKRPPELNNADFGRLRREATKYRFQEGILY
jgi:phosphoenolpyruvate-protein kinase (PTS system EI component)